MDDAEESLLNKMTLDEARALLLKRMFDGLIGPARGKGVSYSLFEETDSRFSFIAALEELDWDSELPVDRYRVDIDRRSRQVTTVAPFALSECELEETIWMATGRRLRSYTRHVDGTLSVSYKILVEGKDGDDDEDREYMVQLRHHGDVASMDALMQMISSTISPKVLPIPTVYPIPDMAERQRQTGMGRQVTSFIRGVMANTIYPNLSHEEKLRFISELATAFAAIWEIAPPQPRLIGELIARQTGGDRGKSVTLSVGPDRHHALGGPFDSVRAYLQAYLTMALEALRRREGIDEYKREYLEPITRLVESSVDSIPEIVEEVPVVCVHADLGPHNIIVSNEQPSEIKAIIDWELVDVAPYLTTYPLIERLFRRVTADGWGVEYPLANELRTKFWESIPQWKREYESEASRVFLKWFRFGLLMKPEPASASGARGEDDGHAGKVWEENIRVVEEMLAEITIRRNGNRRVMS